MTESLSSTQSLLAYFAQRHAKPSVTVLMKLCYLTDLIAIKRSGKQVTTFNYERYTFGPFDKQIYHDLEELVGKDILRTDLYYPSFGQDSEVVLYKFNELQSQPTTLEESAQTVADEVLTTLGGFGAKQLTQVAYQTKPMLALGATLGGTEHLGQKLNLTAK